MLTVDIHPTEVDMVEDLGSFDQLAETTEGFRGHGIIGRAAAAKLKPVVG